MKFLSPLSFLLSFSIAHDGLQADGLNSHVPSGTERWTSPVKTVKVTGKTKPHRTNLHNLYYHTF